MADEDIDGEVRKRFPLLKLLLLLLAVVILLAATAGGTLYLSGFFDRKDVEQAEAALQAMEAQGAEGGAKNLVPQKVARTTPELTRFEQRYLELERDLLANLTNSKKVMQLKLAVMTHYDDRVFNHVRKHEFALRSVALDIMRQTTEAQLASPDFRKQLAARIRDEMNATLIRFEDFGGIEEIFFTSFIVQ